MKLNQDFGMAVETILYLKKRKGNDFVQAEKIAAALKFSAGYLQKVIQSLGRYGIVECKRGRIGGVKLKAKVITLLDLWNVACGGFDLGDPTLTIMEKPLKAFSDAMSKVVIYKK